MERSLIVYESIFWKIGGCKVIKLEDLLLTVCCDVTIMDNIYPALSIGFKHDTWKHFSKDYLDREVKKIDTYNDRIRVWLKEEVTKKK
nr:MAG TPA: hypothetical protein [Caudoviricetes sp.]